MANPLAHLATPLRSFVNKPRDPTIQKALADKCWSAKVVAVAGVITLLALAVFSQSALIIIPSLCGVLIAHDLFHGAENLTCLVKNPPKRLDVEQLWNFIKVGLVIVPWTEGMVKEKLFKYVTEEDKKK